MLASHKEDKLLYPDDHLIWCPKVDSGPCINMTVKNQLLQGQALRQLVENTQQREFDKLFDSIQVYDGEDPEKFEPWLSKLESACLVGKRDVREVAICSST